MKRGQAGIITTILIILVVIVAVVIVWNVVRKTVSSSSEQVEINTVNLDLEYAYFNVSDSSLQITVARLSGKGNVSEIKFILESSDGNFYNYEENRTEYMPDELEKFTFFYYPSTFGLANFNSIIKVSAGYIIKSETGKENVYEISDILNVKETYKNLGSSVVPVIGGEPQQCTPDCNQAINIAYPIDYAIIQRNLEGDENKGDIKIRGNAVLNCALEANFNNNPSWTELGNANGDFNFNLANQNVGQGLLRLRQKGCLEDVSVSNVGIGDIFVIAGQSNALLQGDPNDKQYLSNSPFPNLYVGVNYKNNQWVKADDYLGSSTFSSAYPHMINYLMQDSNLPDMPIGLIQTAVGGKKILQWIKGSHDNSCGCDAYPYVCGSYVETCYDKMYTQVNTATDGVNKFKGMIWFQGETDVSGGTTKTDYITYFNTLYNDLGLGSVTGDFEFDGIVSAQLGSITCCKSGTCGYCERSKMDAIRAAQADLWQDSGSANALAKNYRGPVTIDISLSGLNNVHFCTSDERERLSERWYVALKHAFYDSSIDYKGPVVTSVQCGTESNTILININEVSSLQGVETSKGWRIFNGLTVINDDAISLTKISDSQIKLTYTGAINSGTLTFASFHDVNSGPRDDNAQIGGCGNNYCVQNPICILGTWQSVVKDSSQFSINGNNIQLNLPLQPFSLSFGPCA